MAKPRALRIGIKLTQEQAREFVHRLGSDTYFRKELEKDPKAVLAKYGITVPTEVIPERVLLPPRKAVREVERALEGGGQKVRHGAFSWGCLAYPPGVAARDATGPPFNSCLLWSLAFVAIAAAKPEET
jgi:hypothetical protein